MKKAKAIKVILTFALAGLIGFTSSFAADPANSCIDQLRQKLVEAVKYPEFAKKEVLQGEVTIIFSFMNEKIDVKNIIATDPYLGKYVKEIVSGIYCKSFSKISDKEFKVKIHFSLI